MGDLTTRLAAAVTPRERLAALFAYDAVRATGGPWVDRTPSGRVSSWNRVEGMLLGLAVGDSLGNTSEGLTPESRRELFGEVRDFLPHRHAGNQPVGMPSDDSQMAFWTLDELIRHGELIPERLAARFVSQRIFGIGSSVRQFVSTHA